MPKLGKAPKILLGIAIGLILCCGAPVLWLEHVFAWKEEVISRIPAPSGGRTAIIVETNGGATTSFGYIVRIDRKQAFWAYGATIGERYGVKVRWLDAQTIEVAFDHARYAEKSDVPGIKVVVRGKVDPS